MGTPRSVLLPLAIVLVAVPALGSGLEAQEVGGYPIDEPTIIEACSSCHVQDDEGRLSRISWLRKTPEGWQTSLNRMMALYGVEVDAEQARTIVRYLADEQGLAPEELRPGRFEVERRLVDHDYPGDSGVEYTCIQCHSMGRVITQRRTEEEWGLLLSTHRALYPLVDFQAFRSASLDAGERHPMDEAIEYLAETYPLQTSEWSAWSANMRAPTIVGEWALSGHEPGRGSIYGHVTISADPADPAAFTTEAGYVHAESGERVERTGQVLVYTGYQWRGRSNLGEASELREVMFVERDLQSMSGRWFSGAHDEFGPDVTLRRIGAGPHVTGVYPSALPRGESTTVTVYGANLEGVAEGLDFGEGVTVRSVVNDAGGATTVELDVAPGAPIGSRDLYAGPATLEAAVVVHDGIDRIEVTPLAGLARLGGVVFPKQFQAFDAIGYNDGPDGESGTDDDLSLGRVDVTWRIEEYAAVFGDDDIDFVGRIRPDGVFEPAADGPNPARSGNRNNVGDVWVVATHETEDGEALSARAHLVVTVPLYLRFNPFDPWLEPGDSQ